MICEISSNCGLSTTSILLFAARPDRVELGAMGRYSPLPAAVRF
jgi:hypothetical protein